MNYYHYKLYNHLNILNIIILKYNILLHNLHKLNYFINIIFMMIQLMDMYKIKNLYK